MKLLLFDEFRSLFLNLPEFLLLIARLPHRAQIDNLRMKIKCCDGSIIMCQLTETITQHLGEGTKVQIEGIPKSKNLVQISDFIVLQDDAGDFNMELYNDAVKVQAQNERQNIHLIDNLTEHWGSENEKEIDFVDEIDKQAPNAPNGGANGTAGGQQNGGHYNGGAGQDDFY